MKKNICLVLAAALILLSVSGCANRSGDYRLVDMPEGVSVDAGMLSETLQTDGDIYFSIDYPLVASLPDDGVFVYDVNAKGKYGIFVKYSNTLQYFAWQYINATSVPEIYMSDYDGDGEKELAISLLVNKGATNHNEDLHILKYDGKRFINFIYSAEALESDAKSMVVMTPDENNEKIYNLSTAMSVKTLDLTEREELKSVYYRAIQDFTLGETITGSVAVNFSFGDDLQPVDLGVRIKSDIVLKGDYCSLINPVVEIDGE